MATENLQAQGANMRKTVAASLVVGLLSMQAVAQTHDQQQMAGAQANVGAAPEASLEHFIDSAGRILKIDRKNDLAAEQARLRELKEEKSRRKLRREGANYATTTPGRLDVDSQTIGARALESDRFSQGVVESIATAPADPEPSATSAGHPDQSQTNHVQPKSGPIATGTGGTMSDDVFPTMIEYQKVMNREHRKDRKLSPGDARLRVHSPDGSQTSKLSICEAAKLARDRNSPAAPGLAKQCLDSGGSVPQ